MSDTDGAKRGFDNIIADEAVKSLKEKLDDSSLKSSTRILILVLLALSRRLTSVQLRALTGLGKGSLENHLNRLESFGYVRLSYAKSLGARGGARQTVEITEVGLERCREIVRSMKSLNV